MFENNNNRAISIGEAKRILSKNGNKYSDEEVEKIVDFLHAVADLSAEHLGNEERKGLAGEFQA